MARYLVLSVFIYLLGMPRLVFGLEADSTKVWAYLVEGDAFYEKFKNNLAIESYRKAHHEDSTSYHVLTRLSRTLNEYGMDLEANDQRKEAKVHYEEAIYFAERLLNHYPDSARTYFHLASTKGKYALFQGGRQKLEIGREVEVYCKKGLSLDSTDAELYVAFGVFNREAANLGWMERTIAQALFGPVPDGSRELSLDLLKRAVELDPKFNLAHYELALTYIAMGKREEAVAFLERTRTLPPRTTQDSRNGQLATRMLERIGGVTFQ